MISHNSTQDNLEQQELNKFREIGFNSWDDVYDYFFNLDDNAFQQDNDSFSSTDIGFANIEDAFCSAENGNDAKMFTIKVEDKYIVICLTGIDDESYELEEPDLYPRLFESFDAAMQYVNEIRKTRIRPINTQIADCIKCLNRSDITIEPINHVHSYYYKVYCEGDILIDHLKEINNINYIVACIQKYETFKNWLASNHYELIGIKKWREFASNQQYYFYQIAENNSGEKRIIRGHIKSKLQNKVRCTIDLFPCELYLSEDKLPVSWDDWYNNRCYNCNHKSNCHEA